jgi:YidC/Oxa1 family membrane protein insertase
MDENNKNFIVALVLSVLVFLVWNYFYIVPKQEKLKERQQAEALLKKQSQGANPPKVDGKIQAGTPITPGVVQAPVRVKSRGDILSDASKRIAIDTPAISGSINLVGGRVDDVLLKNFRQKVDKNSPPVEFFSPEGTKHPYFADFGWVSSDSSVLAPKNDTLWTKVSGERLSVGSPVKLQYDNGKGLLFEREISIDERFMFTITQRVMNKGSKALDLSPYGLIYRRNKPISESIFISHEGVVGVFNDELIETTYSDLADDKLEKHTGKTGWVALTDKYWAAALIPDGRHKFSSNFLGNAPEGSDDNYTVNYLLAGQIIEPGKTIEVTNRLYAGAKQGELIETYADTLKINKFTNLIDWGWFHFITKPMFKSLVYFNHLVGNFGLSILIVTVIIKLLLFPLANKSYKSMAYMKKMQPEMEKIRTRYKDDKMKQQQELMELYKKNKINPLSGCWPVLIQIPIFFALYKVLYVTIEMRHAPFVGWIQDLSAPDPTSLFNLFGLIPIDLPQFLMIGIWPLIMGITMFIQMKLNPAPTDAVQAQIFTYMPIIFTFILAGFSSGLVIYWAWNNTLSVIQQYYIMRRHGVEVNLLENMGFKKKST